MKILQLNHYIICANLLLSTPIVWALVPNVTYWQCTVTDATFKEFSEQSDYQLTAINKAFANCKKQSELPATCRSSKENCEMIVNGVSARPMWRCMALDLSANPWFSNIYAHALDAAFAARAYCQANSSLPDTCYVYLFNCRDLNLRKI